MLLFSLFPFGPEWSCGFSFLVLGGHRKLALLSSDLEKLSVLNSSDPHQWEEGVLGYQREHGDGAVWYKWEEVRGDLKEHGY